MQDKDNSIFELLTFENKMSELHLNIILQNLLKEAKVDMMIYNIIRFKAKIVVALAVSGILSILFWERCSIPIPLSNVKKKN